MATEQIIIQGRAEMSEIDRALALTGRNINQFNNHLQKNFMSLSKGRQAIDQFTGKQRGLGMLMKGMQKEMLTGSQINKQFTKSFQKQMDMMQVQPIDSFGQAMSRAGITQKQFTKAMPDWKDMGGEMWNRVTGQVMSYGQAVGNAAIKSRRFKFEWLSIMFAGMALDRVFGGLIRTQMQLWGVSEGLAGMWTVVMVPAMEKITPLLWNIVEGMSGLPEPIQLAIGFAVLFVGALGKILLYGGQLMLLLGGLRIFFPALFSKMGIAVGAFLGVAWLPLLAAIGVIIVLALAIYLAWKTNFMNIRDTIAKFIAAFKQWFGGLISIVKGVLNIIKGIFTGDFELVKKGIIGIFKGLWNMLLGGWKMLGYGIVVIFKGVVKLIWNVFKVVVDAILWAADKASRLFGGKGVSIRMPKFQSGGLVAQTGPAFLHAGERVIPKGRANQGGGIVFSPTINLNASINNDMDVRILAEKLNRFWARDFERLLQGRGSY